MRARRLACLAVVCLAAAACAPRFALPTPAADGVAAERRRQYADGVEHMFAYWSRAADVASAVRIHGAELCGRNVRAALGVIALSSGDLPWLFGEGGFWHEFRDVFEQSFHIDGRVRVIEVTPRGPGDLAGIRTGDIILSLGGKSVGDEEELAARQADPDDAEFEVVVERDGRPLTLHVARVPECGYDLGLVASPFPNAYAYNATLYVSTGLVRDV